MFRDTRAFGIVRNGIRHRKPKPTGFLLLPSPFTLTTTSQLRLEQPNFDLDTTHFLHQLLCRGSFILLRAPLNGHCVSLRARNFFVKGRHKRLHVCAGRSGIMVFDEARCTNAGDPCSHHIGWEVAKFLQGTLERLSSCDRRNGPLVGRREPERFHLQLAVRCVSFFTVSRVGVCLH